MLSHSYFSSRTFSMIMALGLGACLMGIAFYCGYCDVTRLFPAYIFEHNRYLNIMGIGCILMLAVAFSRDRAAINGVLVAKALVLQGVCGFVMLKTTWGQWAIGSVAFGINRLYQCADEGISFVFGQLAYPGGPWAFIFAIKVLPIIIFFGALMSLLFYWGIVQRVVTLLSYALQPLLGTSGAETLCAIANSFLGQTESPLLIKNYLKDMTKSELFVVMVSGMSTISGAILAVFAAMGVPAEHMLAASIMAIPASILIAKIIYPETGRPVTMQGTSAVESSASKNVFDAIATGTTDGLSLALNVGAMLIVFISLIALLNAILMNGSYYCNSLLAWVGLAVQVPLISLGWVFGKIFAPIAYLLGFTGDQAVQAAQLLGTKVTVNELVAYQGMVQSGFSERSVAILTYALCGFSNFSCIGIQVGGIGALVPEKREWLTQLGLHAVLASSLANLLSALVAGILL